MDNQTTLSPQAYTVLVQDSLLNITEEAVITDITTSSSNCSSETNGSEFEFYLYSIICPILFGAIAVVGVIGNSLVIYVILKKDKLRTTTNLMLLNLAVADLSFIVVCVPFTAYYYATEHWPFGNALCKLMHYLLNVTAYVTVYTLVCISLLRLFIIVYSQQTMKLRTKKNVIIVICLIWVIMLLMNTPVIFTHGTIRNGDKIECYNFGGNIGKGLYATFFGFAFVLPLSMITFIYLAILHFIRKQRPQSQAVTTKRSSSRKKRASTMIVVVIIIFGICWLPLHIHLLVAYFGIISQSPFYQTVSLFWNCLAYTNSCVNPIIYNYTSGEFRESFREAICCGCKTNEASIVELRTGNSRAPVSKSTKSTYLNYSQNGNVKMTLKRENEINYV